MRGPAPASPLNNKTFELLQTAFCVYHLVCAPHLPLSAGKREGHACKQMGIWCKMCIFLHVGGLWPHIGRYAPVPAGPPDRQVGGGAKQGAGGLKLSYAIHTHAHTHTQTHTHTHIYIYIYIYIYGITTAVCLPGYRGKRWAWVRE